MKNRIGFRSEKDSRQDRERDGKPWRNLKMSEIVRVALEYGLEKIEREGISYSIQKPRTADLTETVIGEEKLIKTDAHKDASRTSVILCHTSPRTLWRHYRGNATAADGEAWFKILPTSGKP